MKHIKIGIALGVAGAMASVPSSADSHRKDPGGARWIDSCMQEVSIGSEVGQPGHGWRYFSDAHEGRAVVISPGGDYYYSHGDGLTLVFKATTST